MENIAEVNHITFLLGEAKLQTTLLSNLKLTSRVGSVRIDIPSADHSDSGDKPVVLADGWFKIEREKAKSSDKVPELHVKIELHKQSAEEVPGKAHESEASVGESDVDSVATATPPDSPRDSDSMHGKNSRSISNSNSSVPSSLNSSANEVAGSESTKNESIPVVGILSCYCEAAIEL